MSVFDAVAPPKPTAEQGAVRVKRSLAQAFHQIEGSLSQVCNICERHGADDVAAVLGDDKKEVKQLYKALKEFVKKHKPDASVEDLPL